MDLSHWDLVRNFNIEEAAFLAVGVDPNLQQKSDEQTAKAILLKRELTKAYDAAVSSANYFLVGQRDADETQDSILVPRSLPSSEVEIMINWCLQKGVDFEKSQLIPTESQRFSRKNLANWFGEMHFKSAYSFVLREKEETAEQTSANQSLHPRTKNNYLRLIMALANMSIKGFDPKKPYEAAAKIVKETDLEIDEKTVARIVSEAHELQFKESQ